MGSCNCTGPYGKCPCMGGGNASYSTKVVRAQPFGRVNRADLDVEGMHTLDRLNLFTVEQLTKVMRERGVQGCISNMPKEAMIHRLYSDLLVSDEEEMVKEYEERYFG